MAENKTINIKINSNTKEATQDTKDYNKAIGSTKKQYDAVLKSGDSYDKQLKDINKIVKETPLNVRDMNKQIQAYQSIALSAGRETPVGKEALQKASELRDRYIDIQNETKRLADDQKNLQGALQLVGTGVAAFGGIQSAMALSGVESEKLRETMVKLMAAQTLMNSINQIATALEKESSAMLLLKSARTKILASSIYAYATAQGVATKGVKLFRLALISTGIGAIIVAVGLLVANWSKLNKAISGGSKGLKNSSAMVKVLMVAFAPLILTIKAVQKGLELVGLSSKRNLEAEKKQAEFRKEEAKADEDRWNAKRDRLNKEFDLKQKLAKKEIDLAKAKGEETAEAERKLITDAIANAEKKAKDDKSKFDEEAEGQIKYLENRVNEQKKALELINELEGRGVRKRIKLTNEEKEILQEAGEDRYSHVSDVERKLESSNKELNEYRIKQNSKWIKTTKGDVESLQKDLEIFDAGEVKATDDKLKAKRDKWKAYAKFRLDTARKIEDLENSLLEDGIEKDLEINRDKFRRLQEDTKKNTKLTAKEKKELNDLYTEQQEKSEEKIREKYDKIESDREKKRLENIAKQNNDFLKTIEDIAEQNYQNTLTDEERELTAVQDKYFALEEAAQGNAEALNEIEIARLNELNEIYVKYDDERDAAQKVRDDKAKADAKALEDYKISVVQGGLSAINDIAALFAKGNEKQQKRAFQVQKAVGIAQATINTAQAITKVFAETTDFTPTQSLRIANAVGIGIAGAAQIASIASQQFTGGGDVESPTDIGGAGGGEAVAPSFNVVGDSGINQIAQLQQQPTQAYVVSGEVTTSQALDRNRVQNATL
jgi:hypothetical protein